MTVISAGAMVIDGQTCRPGWLETSGRQIVACGAGTPPGPADAELPDSIVVPGFIDMHVHGGGGASFTVATIRWMPPGSGATTTSPAGEK